MNRVVRRRRRLAAASRPWRRFRSSLGRGIFALSLVMALLLPTTTAWAGMLEDRLDATRAEAQDAKAELSVIDRRQQNVVRQVSRLNDRLAELQRPLDLLEAELNGLEYRIERREARIVELKAERIKQAKEIERLQAEVDAARAVLADRVVTAYKTGDTGVIEHLAGAGSLQDLFAREEALSRVVGLDDEVIERIARAERAVRAKRAHNVEMRAQIRADIEQLELDRAAVDGERARAQRARDAVAAVRAERDAALAELRKRKETLAEHLDSLENDAEMLTEVIRTGHVSYNPGGGPGTGFIWPVSGPIVSPFGWRWGRMHEGVDIAVGTGTPIYAAAGGVVIYAGWMSGYGNLVLVQHSGNLVTAYAHQSQIATSVGQPVGQGQLLGFVGCTGHCFGPHLHFETRLAEQPVDPMQFL